MPTTATAPPNAGRLAWLAGRTSEGTALLLSGSSNVRLVFGGLGLSPAIIDDVHAITDLCDELGARQSEPRVVGPDVDGVTTIVSTVQPQGQWPSATER